jgi:hypothetical protein
MGSGASNKPALIAFSPRKPKPSQFETVDVDAELIVDEELALTDDDLVEASPQPPPTAGARTWRRPSLRLSAIDPLAESNVAAECVASIAAEASRARGSDPRTGTGRVGARSDTFSSHVPRVSSQLFDAGEIDRASDIAEAFPARTEPGDRSSPLRTSTPFARTTTDAWASSLVPTGGSVAPVSLAASEPTVIIVRDRPRVAWVVAAAMIGALAAFAVIRVAAAPAPAPARTAEVIARPAQPRAEPAVVRFDDGDGVVIQMPAPIPVIAASALPEARASGVPQAASPAVRAAVSAPILAESLPAPRSATPKVTSSSLANESRGGASSSASAAPPASPPARKLTPEQELAEAQLRAAAR